MPDIFDQLSPEPAAPKRDVFDDVAGDIFDQITQPVPGQAPTLAPDNRIPTIADTTAGGPPVRTGGFGLTQLTDAVGDTAANTAQDAFTPLVELVPKATVDTAGRLLSTVTDFAEMNPDSTVGETLVNNLPSDKAVAIGVGTQNAVADAANSFTSPVGIATLGQGALPRTA